MDLSQLHLDFPIQVCIWFLIDHQNCLYICVVSLQSFFHGGNTENWRGENSWGDKAEDLIVFGFLVESDRLSYLYSEKKILFYFILGWRTWLRLKACCIFIFVQNRGNYFICSNNSSKFEGTYQWFTCELTLPPVHIVFATYSS